jgi:hypothetical protein
MACRCGWIEFELRRPRQWGACWVGCHLWDQLKLDEFWRDRLPDSREGTCWRQVLETLTVYRLIDPGSEWRLHRQWFQNSAMADLLEEDFSLGGKDNCIGAWTRCWNIGPALFQHLRRRWEDLFGVKFEVLLYDLTSTYFESDPSFPEGDKRQYGYSRDKRPDCVQVVIALVVTPEGFPLAYEVMAGNTADKTTLRGFLKKIEELYGKAERVWVMDRGIPTEEVLAEMRASDPPVHYLVGTPKGRLSRYEKALLEQPWQAVRDGVQVKLLAQEGELYVLAESRDRVSKERSMRRRQLKGLVKRLKELAKMELTRDQLLLKLGAAKSQFPAAWRLVAIQTPEEGQEMMSAQFHVPIAQGQAAPSAEAGGAVSVAQQPERAGTGEAVAVLHSTHASGSGVQRPQGRLEPAPHFPSIGAADRGAHLCLLSGLVPARQLAGLFEAAGSGPDAALAAGQVRGHPNARRAFPDDRRTGTGLLPLHAAGEGSQNAAGPIGLGTAAAIAAAHHAERTTDDRVTLVQTFLAAALICNDLHIVTPSSSESRAKGVTH